jgi:hypothetical protein
MITIIIIIIISIILLFFTIYFFTKPKVYVPTNVEKYFIYDVFQNDNEELIVVCAPEILPPFKMYYINNENQENEMKIILCPQNHTLIYKHKMENYYPEVNLKIDNHILTLQCNKYPVFKNEIIMNTIVKDEDDYVIQWIKYHMVLGIKRYIIYDNSHSNTLQYVLRKYIRDGTVVLIQWRYTYTLPTTGHSGQTTSENHSIYAFQTCKYIGFFDVDEYINPQTDIIDINDFLKDVITVNNISVNNIACFVFSCKIFKNVKKQPTDGYKFLDIYDCGNILTKFREKSFCIPRNTEIFSIHVTVSGGQTNFYIDQTKCYFNHYVFLNKPPEIDRMPSENVDQIDDSVKRIVSMIP